MKKPPLSGILFAALLSFAPLAHAQWVSQLPQNRQQQTMPQAKPKPQPRPQPAAQAQRPLPPAASSSKILAVVNDAPITTNDVTQRLRLALMASGLPNTPDVQQHIVPQILRGLIDEQLQLQEAKRLDITVSKEEVEKAMQRVAADNNVNGDMRQFLASRGASPAAMEQQIKASISWNKVIQRELRSRVEVSDDEINAAIDRIRANVGKQEFWVSEIFLAVDGSKDEDQVKNAADNLVAQIKKGTAFSAVAHQFSQSTGAAAGGDLGWIQEGQLPQELDRVLVNMQTRSLAGPIRSANGWHILALREKRMITLGDADPNDVTMTLQQALRPAVSPQDKMAAAQEADALRAAVTDCKELSGKVSEKFPKWKVQDLGTTKLAQAPAWMVDRVRGLPVGKGSDAMETEKGILMLFMCNRQAPEGAVNRDAIASAIGSEKMELQARRLQRDLRRNAFIDIRLGNNKS